MRDTRRFFWTAALLLMAGCQSMPAGTSALFRLRDSAPDAIFASAGTQAAESSRSRALFGSNRKMSLDGRTDSIESRIAQLLKSARGRSDSDHEASVPETGSLDGDTNIPDSPEGELQSPSFQQIILTNHGVERRPDSTDSPDDESTVVSPAGAAPEAPPVAGDRGELSAPAPYGHSARGTDSEEPVDQEQDDAGAVASVFDVFGIGGERDAAREEVAGSTAIQPAGLERESGVSPPASIDLQTTRSLQSVFWQEDLDKLIALLEAQVSQQTPGNSADERELYIRQHVALRMLYLISSRRPEALQAIPDLAHNDQEFWTQMFWALSSTFDDEAMPNSTLRATEAISHLREAVRQLESQASLQVKETLFCQRIDGFGDYVPFEEDEFAPGQPVLVYTELRNFQSQATVEGDFRTVLRSSITIREGNVGGRTVFVSDLPESEDRCRSRRRDYFHSYRIRLPDTLNPGPHVLTLDVTDTLTGKTGQATLRFVAR